jgi:hypothetical protein
MSAPAQSWCDPAGASPAQVRGSVHLVASVAGPLVTVVAKRTQRLHVRLRPNLYFLYSSVLR